MVLISKCIRVFKLMVRLGGCFKLQRDEYEKKEFKANKTLNIVYLSVKFYAKYHIAHPLFFLIERYH